MYHAIWAGKREKFIITIDFKQFQQQKIAFVLIEALVEKLSECCQEDTETNLLFEIISIVGYFRFA